MLSFYIYLWVGTYACVCCVCVCLLCSSFAVTWNLCRRLPGWQQILCRILAFNFTRNVSSYGNNDNNNRQSVVATENAAISRIFLGSCKTIPSVSLVLLLILLYLSHGSAQLSLARLSAFAWRIKFYVCLLMCCQHIHFKHSAAFACKECVSVALELSLSLSLNANLAAEWT